MSGAKPGLFYLRTAGELYLHFHDHTPRFFVATNPALLPLRSGDLPLYLVRPEEWRAPTYHAALHTRLQNVCRGLGQPALRRAGQDAAYGDHIRRTLGCWDTPIFDVDMIGYEPGEGSDRRLAEVVELKRRGEAASAAQNKVLPQLWGFGIAVSWWQVG